MRRRNLLIAALFLLVIGLPYVYAVFAAGPDHVFGGFLLNPQDGNSYLAKMYQGWRGEWRFRLPFTAEPGQGAYLFLFYLFLGHIARGLALPLLLVFHMARILAAFSLFWALEIFWRELMPDDRHPDALLPISLFGSGAGWLIFLTGTLTSDFWVAETYPFLSSYANPHFPLGLAISLWLLVVAMRRQKGIDSTHTPQRASLLLIVLAAFLLSVVMPFGVVVVLVILGGVFLWQLGNEFARKRDGEQDILWKESVVGWSWVIGCVILGGAPLIIYDQAVIYLDPVFANWNVQNFTPSPPVWDVIIALSPALLAALAGIWVSFRKESLGARLLTVWGILGFLLLYFPFSLQRRFMFGLYIPITGLAGAWLASISSQGKRWTDLFSRGLLIVSLPTNLIILLVAQFGIQSHDPLYYLTKDEHQALTWIQEHTPQQALILASPEMGMYIPAHTGRRVLYGHPFETMNADLMEIETAKFYSEAGALSQADLLYRYSVDYIFYGPRERALGPLPDLSQLELVYVQGDVAIYQVE